MVMVSAARRVARGAVAYPKTKAVPTHCARQNGQVSSSPTACLAQWVGTGFVFGYVTAPRATRLAALTMTMVAGSDVLQFAYDAIQNGSLDPEDHDPEPPR